MFGDDGYDPHQLADELRARGINTNAQGTESGVIDFAEKKITKLLRISPHYYHTGQEIDQTISAIDELCR